MKTGRKVVAALLRAPEEEAERTVLEMEAARLRRLAEEWPAWLHQGQEPPEGDDWRVWVMLAGRGFGKTRAGAEWISEMARTHPRAAIALVAANIDEARRVMVEGPSGLLAGARAAERGKMRWEPTKRRLLFASGAEARLFSGAHANSLRGFEHHFAWCDELAKWRQAEAAWDNLMLGLRLGDNPRAVVTTTPKSIAALTAIVADAETVRSGGASAANPHVSPRFLASMERQHGGTRLGRQELDGELIEEVEGALWPRELIEACRLPLSLTLFPEGERGFLRRVVIGVDPPAGPSTSSGQGRGDACGIVAVGLGRDGVGYVIGDHSVAGLSPEGWARKVAAAAQAHGAAQVIAEANNGGKMVESVLRGAGVTLPVRLVHAAEAKVARAAPVAALFESGSAKFAGRFAALEDELAGLSWSGPYEGPGRSPDRADAMVWAFTELMLGKKPAEPRITSF